MALAVCGISLVGDQVPAGGGSGSTANGFTGPGSLSAATSTGVIIDRPVRVNARPAITIESMAVEPRDGAKARAPAASIAATRHIVLHRPIISIEVSGATATATDGLTPVLSEIVARLARLDLDTLAVRQGTIHLTSAGRPFETLRDVDAELTTNRSRTITVAAEITFHGQKLKLAGTLARPALATGSTNWPLQLTVASSVLQARLDGMLAEEKGLRFTGTAEATVPRLSTLALWVGTSLPRALALQSARLRGKLDWNGGNLAFADTTLALDGNEGKGSIAFARTGGRLSVEGTMAFKQLDLRPLLVSAITDRSGLAEALKGSPLDGGSVTAPERGSSPLAPPERGSSPLAPPERGSSPLAPPERGSWFSFDADLRISTDALRVPGISTGQGAATITLKGGRLLADIAELAIEGGVFRGQFTAAAESTSTRYGVDGKLEDVEAGRILMNAFDRNPLQGRADIKLALKSRGDTLDHALSELSGTADLTLRKGGRLGLDLRALMRSAKQSDIRGWSVPTSSSTGLDELRIELNVNNGLVHTRTLEAKSGSLAILGSGSVDLTERALDVWLRFGTAESWGKTFDQGEALVLSGPWVSPLMGLEKVPQAKLPSKDPAPDPRR